MTDADRFHIPPSECTFCGPSFLGTCPHGPKASAKSDLVERMLGIQRQPAPIDISPLVAIIDREMSRLRDQLAVERSATSSAREALAACEERMRALSATKCEAAPTVDNTKDAHWNAYNPARMARDLGKLEVRYAQRCDRNAQLRVANVAMRQERDAALERVAALQAKLDAANGDVIELERVQQLVPGSTAAVIEAYRLLSGYEPVFGANGQWDDGALPTDPNYDAERALLVWLNKNARDGSRT